MQNYNRSGPRVFPEAIPIHVRIRKAPLDLTFGQVNEVSRIHEQQMLNPNRSQ